MSRDASSAMPKPRICLWCSSTNTFAAQRCLFCGMDLGEELQRVRAQQARAASGARRQPATARLVAWLALAPLVLLLGLLVLHLAGTLR